ncbi:hypothetical protein LguiB_010910 [Lonicera macranthoides]
METPMEESPALTNLIASLEQATIMAKQLQITKNPNQILQIYSSLHSSHHHLSSFLSHHPQPHPSLHPPPPPDNSSSDEPMDGDNEEVEMVGEKMRDFCFVQNKRKRALSPAAEAELRRPELEEVGRRSEEFDPVGNRLRSLNLIYQFHC